MSRALLVFTLFFFLSAARGAEPSRTREFELEVAVCPEGVLSLTALEYPFLKGKPLRSFPDGIETAFSKSMSAFSPARADLMVRFESEYWSKLQTLSGSTIRPRLPTTVLFEREDCKTRVLAKVAVNPLGEIQGLIDQNLWKSASRGTQTLILAEASLYFESLVWILTDTPQRSPSDWNPPQLRNFLIEWLSDDQPHSTADFFRLAVASELAFLEQAGAIIPLSARPPDWHPNGLVSRSYTGYQLHSEFSASKSPWRSDLQLGNQTLSLRGWFPTSNRDFIEFFPNGRIRRFPSVDRRTPYVFPRLNADDRWIGDLWLYEDGSVNEGYLIVPWQTPAHWMFGLSQMTIEGDPLAGGPDQGTRIRFFPNGKIRAVESSRGTVTLQGKTVEVRGPLRFESGERLACATLPKGSQWLDANGTLITIPSTATTTCFDANERVTSMCESAFCLPDQRAY